MKDRPTPEELFVYEKNRRIDVGKSLLLSNSYELVVGRFDYPGDAPEDSHQDANQLMLLGRKEGEDLVLDLHGAYAVGSIGSSISIRFKDGITRRVALVQHL